MRDLELERVIYLLDQVSPSQRWRWFWGFRWAVIRNCVTRRDWRGLSGQLVDLPGFLWRGLILAIGCA